MSALKTILGVVLIAFSGHAVFFYHRVTFQTHHTFCLDCARSEILRSGVSRTLHYLSFAILFVSLCAVTISAMMVGVAIYTAHEMFLGAILFLCGASVPLGLSIVGFQFCRRLGVPVALRPIGRFPFSVKRFDRVD